MSLKRAEVVSRGLILVALSAALLQVLFDYTAAGFSGAPTTTIDRVTIGASLMFWLPVAASWKFPRIGFVCFVTLLGVVLAICASSVSRLAECLYALIFPVISGVSLLLNLLFIEFVRHTVDGHRFR